MAGQSGTGASGVGGGTSGTGGATAGTGGQMSGTGGQTAGTTGQMTGVSGAGDGGTAGTGGAAGAGGTVGAGGAAGGTAGVGGAAGSTTLIACGDLFDPNVLQAYQVEISADEWAKLTVEFLDIKDVLAGNPHETYHPIILHRGAEMVTDAAIRLKGQSSWTDTVSYDPNPKMQFVIAFDQTDPKGLFHGVSKIDFDMPRSDWSFLNERLANTWFRQTGILAPCANSARLTINGAYYGLYTSEESKGGRLIKEFFPGNSSGDFFKGGIQPEGMTLSTNWPRQAQFWAAKDIVAVARIVDLPSSLREWAAEALLNDSDGYYGGSHNFYLYDQGAAGYAFLPTDVDATFEWMSVFTGIGYKQHPIFWWAKRPFPQPPGQHYLIVMNDATARMSYVDSISSQLARWDVGQIQGWIDTWSAQIADAVNADPRKWATSGQFTMAVAAARDMVAQRPAFLQTFVACERGQPADDKDGDGVVWCNDCADDDPTVHPGAAEVCGNNIDDNCNGVVDENCPGEPPGYPGQMAAGGAGGAAGVMGTGGAGGQP